MNVFAEFISSPENVVEVPPDLATRISFTFSVWPVFRGRHSVVIVKCGVIDMLGDVHEGLDLPSEVVESAIVRGKYEFYHYNVDGIDDRVSHRWV